MDVPPLANSTHGTAKTIVLLHGKNFCGVTWRATIDVLRAQGYRVIVPDAIGFCKSDKPTGYAYSLQQLAANTKAILDGINATAPLTVMGHSLGGMLATRFALTFPERVARLVLVDPIGLEDWTAAGVPYRSIDALYAAERTSNYTLVRAYEQSTYYAGAWAPAYDVWVNMLLRVYQGTMADAFAYVQALVTHMVLTQPIAHEFPRLAGTPTLLIVGQKDTTAIGKQWAPPAVQAALGDYRVLGYRTAAAIGANCTLVEYEDLGHAPQIQDPERFHRTLLGWLG